MTIDTYIHRDRDSVTHREGEKERRREGEKERERECWRQPLCLETDENQVLESEEFMLT